jgi:hypothetical protein
MRSSDFLEDGMPGRVVLLAATAAALLFSPGTPVRADPISDRARPVLVEIVIQCRHAWEAYLKRPPRDPDICTEAMDRWDLLPDADRTPEMSGYMLGLLSAGIEAQTASYQLATGKRFDDARRAKFDTMAKAIDRIADALRR